MSAAKAKIIVQGPLNFEMEVSNELALRVVLFVTNATSTELKPILEGAVTAVESIAPGKLPSDPAGFVNTCNPRTRQGEILAMAGYLKLVEGKETTDRDELRGLYKAVARPMPKNFSRDFMETVGKGWIAPERNSNGKFYVTQAGIAMINGGFEGEFKGRGKGK